MVKQSNKYRTARAAHIIQVKRRKIEMYYLTLTHVRNMHTHTLKIHCRFKRFKEQMLIFIRTKNVYDHKKRIFLL